MNIGFGIDTDSWRLRFGLRTREFFWMPGIEESGNSMPAQFFNAMSDRYWMWSWLWFTVFFAEAKP